MEAPDRPGHSETGIAKEIITKQTELALEGIDAKDLEKVIIDKSKGLLEDKKKAFDIINGLDDNMHRIVLIERYFNSEPWKSIAIHISRSEKRTRQIHDKAIKLCEIRRETDVRL